MNAGDPRGYLATAKARTLAYMVDACFAALVLVPLAYRAYWVEAGYPGLPEFSAVLFAYHLAFLLLRGGVSPGKYLLNIAVVSISSGQLVLWQGLLRSASLCVPWLLFYAADNLPTKIALFKPISGELGTLAALYLVVDALLIEFSIERRSLTDRMARTLVIALPPPEPHRAPAVPMFSATDAEFGNPPKRPKSE